MNVTIRKAGEQDFKVVLSLIKEFSIFQKTPEKVTITLQQMIEGKDSFKCIVAEAENKEIVGFATFFFAWYSWTGKALYLDDLYVRETFRNQSTGKKLLETIISLAKDEQCKKVRWQVSKWNANAIDFYKKIGAAVDETEINCDYNIT
ncbi:MAG: family N-acetyltransferase [Segetibacter sp.]|nr:family N-acetyltransferase [Segetibacter sp.]